MDRQKKIIMREILGKTYWVLSSQLGLDPRRVLRSLRGLPRYIADLFRFRKTYQGRLGLLPCLSDWYEEGGTTTSEYFLQDLHVARKIHDARPAKHVDIGSRVDGFVAHVASFRQIEVFDIRPVTSVIPGVTFKQEDLMNPSKPLTAQCDSLSCLHALEHFGLGRYGDPIDPDGYATGLKNMARLVMAGGTYYLSVPIGQGRVEFNAHRIFDPLSLVRLAMANDLVLRDFAWVEPRLGLVESTHPQEDMRRLSTVRYALGIFTFIKH
jgi:hypothetical protein